MKIYHNLSAMSILNKADRNQKKGNKALKQLGLGEKITSAGDDASGYAISERMKAKIRGLDQDQENVKKGASMLRVAEGAIQSQINLLKTVKEKTIDAANDTNTDLDRQIIQKEINHCYEQINDIAAQTTYNGLQLLMGNAVAEKFGSWVVLDHAEKVEDSDLMNIIPDVYDTLDGQTGPFDIFGTTSNIDGYKLETVDTFSMSGGTVGTANTIDIDLSGYSDISKLNNVAFQVRGLNESGGDYYYFYVLTDDTKNNYNLSRLKKIDISTLSDKGKVASAIADAINSSMSSCYSAAANGEKVTLTSKNLSTLANNSYYTVTGQETAAKSGTSTSGEHRTAASAPTGCVISQTTKGVDAQYETVYEPSPTDPDGTVAKQKKVADGVSAVYTVTGVSSAETGSGLTLKACYRSASSTYNSYMYLQFIDGDSAPARNTTLGDYNYYTVGKNYTGKFRYSHMELNFAEGNLTMTADGGDNAAAGNNSSITLGITSSEKSSSSYNYVGTSALTGITNHKSATNGATASYTLGLSEYNGNSPDTVEKLIDDYVGKALACSYSSTSYEFIDSAAKPKLDSISKIDGSVVIDLNLLRSLTNDTTTAAKAFASLLAGKMENGNTENVTDDTGNITGLKIKASTYGTTGNSQKVYLKQGNLRSYTLDYGTWFKNNNVGDIAEYLNGKGFRFYCPTDPDQWFNIAFSNTEDEEDDKPKSGIAGVVDIKTLQVDVTNVTDASSLVKAIYEQAEPLLESGNTYYNHNFRLAADYDAGVLTVYDKRADTLTNYAKNHSENKANPMQYTMQEKGAKIADGVLDNVVKDYRYLYVKDMYIQHTTEASKNIHIKIPQTSMDQIFGYKIGTHDIEEYNVLTKDMRDQLLGDDVTTGILDSGLQYLIDANTLIGAQVNHMESAENNIVTETENVTNSESVIRDTDMAKAIMEYTKYNLLSQAAQSMLAQANQAPERTLSLLQ